MQNDALMNILHTGEWVGWVATALFAASYLVSKPMHLLLLQALAGGLWIAYALVIGALPVLIANGVVAAGALYKASRIWRASRGTVSQAIEPPPYH